MKRFLMLALVAMCTMGLSVAWVSPRAWIGPQEEDAGQGIPHYNPAPPKKADKLPPILPPEVLWQQNFQQPFQAHAYELASKIPNVLHQQPCYCFCDRMGHKSLRTCYETTHAANCSACLKELFYTYQEHKKGKTAAQIRKGIIKGDWKQINLQTATEIN